MDAVSAANVVENSTLLLAVLVPLIGSLVVMTMKDNPNLREFISSCSSVLLFILVLSFIPALREGKTLVYTIFDILPGLSVTLRADGFSMIFALVASSLWIIAVFYSMGYMPWNPHLRGFRTPLMPVPHCANLVVSKSQ